MAFTDRLLPLFSLESKLLELHYRLKSKLEVCSRTFVCVRHFVKFALIAVAVALSSCRAVVDTKVEKDGSGELRTSIVFSEEEKRSFDSAPGNVGKNICDSLRGDAPPDAVFIEEARGDEIFCTTLHPFQTLKQLRDLYEGMANVTVNELSMVLSRFAFNIQVDLTSQDKNEAEPNEWRLTLPGEIGDNNADLVESNTLVWNIEPGEVRVLEAESSVGSGLLTPIVVGGVLVLVGIIFAVRLAQNTAKQNKLRSDATPLVIYPPTR